MSQVTLFILHTQIYTHFGTDNEVAITEADFPTLRKFDVDLDNWRTQWEPRSANNQYVHTYPSKGVILHYFFAKFQLNALAFRALPTENLHSLSSARRESANTAISSAMKVLAFILDEPDVRDHIIGVPLFTHTMLAFSAVFLLKVALKWNSIHDFPGSTPGPFPLHGIYINSDAVKDMVNRIVILLHGSVASEKHLTVCCSSSRNSSSCTVL